MDALDFLDGETVEPTAVAANPEAPPPVDPASAEGQPRGPDGKFAPKAQAEAAPAVDAQPLVPADPATAAQPASDLTKPPEGFVPVAALQAIREELNAFKRAQQQPPPPAPDPYEDFEGYQAWQNGQMASERAGWSRQLAEAKHGPDLVQKAQQWAFERFDTDPVFAQSAQSSRDPYGFAIAEFQRHEALSLLSDPANLAKFQAFLAGGPAAASPAPALTVAPPSQPSPPPRSIASAPNAGAAKPGEVQPGTAFDMVFKD